MVKTTNQFSVIIFLIIVFFTSCANTKKTTYFNNQNDVSFKTVVPKAVIQPNDLLSISVSSLNPNATAVFNMPNVIYSATGPSGNQAFQTSGYLVNAEGFIQFPILGDIKAAGLTNNELRQLIVKTLVAKELLSDPIVSVRHLNFKVSVLGEVAHPTVINVPNQKISLLEALALAGDVTIYGRKDNVMVIREEKDQQTIKRLNLNSTELFNSPYYYLQSNDVIYVEANKSKVASSARSNQILPVILSGLSFAAIIVDRLTR